jgi:hypothetical protein
MSDSNQILLAFAPETTFNTHPSASGDWTALRVLSESLKQDLSLNSSNEIRGYRDIPALNKTDRAVSGSLNQSLYYDDNATAELMRYAMASAAWSASGADTSVVSASACTVSNSTRTIDLDTGSWANTPAVGSWIYVSGAADAITNGLHQVATSGAATLTTNSALGADEGATMTIVELSEITNGNTLTTMSIQRDYSDLSSVGEYFTGCAIDGISLDASGQETVKLTTDVMGVTALSDTASETVDNAASTLAEMTSIDGVQWVREGTGAGNVADLNVLGFTMAITNGTRKQYQLGTFGAAALKQGDFTVTGTMQMLFADSTIMDKFLNQTATGLAIAISDEATAKGNAFVFDMPNVRFTDGARVAGGRNQDIIADMTWQAIYNGSSHTMKISKIASA